MAKRSVARSEEIHKLFDAVAFETGAREYEIFRNVYADGEEAREKMWHFLKNVGGCPPEIVLFCQALLTGRKTLRNCQRNGA